MSQSLNDVPLHWIEVHFRILCWFAGFAGKASVDTGNPDTGLQFGEHAAEVCFQFVLLMLFESVNLWHGISGILTCNGKISNGPTATYAQKSAGNQLQIQIYMYTDTLSQAFFVVALCLGKGAADSHPLTLNHVSPLRIVLRQGSALPIVVPTPSAPLLFRMCAVFIRAPAILRTGQSVRELAKVGIDDWKW